jgi:hypothetical protein
MGHFAGAAGIEDGSRIRQYLVWTSIERNCLLDLTRGKIRGKSVLNFARRVSVFIESFEHKSSMPISIEEIRSLVALSLDLRVSSA